tara:strand:- start:34043 stop:36022 length:1980 start_codon:yes stop_codon:yes gene_type:complete
MHPRLQRIALVGTAFAGIAFAVACGDDAKPGPPTRTPDLEPETAQMGAADTVRFDLEAVRHASDGGGSARIADGSTTSAYVLSRATFRILYTVGPLGIATGGVIQFQPESSFDWSPPQTSDADRLGYTTFRTEAEGVELVEQRASRVLRLKVEGRALLEGETVEIVYGAGAGAKTDPYADRAARLWLQVDGDGDGVSAFVVDSPTVTLLAGRADRIVVNVTSTAKLGDKVRIHIAVLDLMANRGVDTWGNLVFPNRQGFGGLPESIALPPEAGGVLELEATANEVGVHRLPVRLDSDAGGFLTVSNPLWVDEDAPSVLWADLHGHSGLSDGTGTPQDYYAYAREVAGLDVVALTDHDHWGVRHVTGHPDVWRSILDATALHHEPGRFITIPGIEWTNWIHGHRHVLWFEDAPTPVGWIEQDTPTKLWDALRGRPALTFAHHSSGRPVPTNWSFVPDPVLEPLTEICSTHGSSEAADAPSVVRDSRRGQFVRDQLIDGVRLGFVGSGDSHDGHPGLAHLSPQAGWSRRDQGERAGRGGLTAILTDDVSREGVLAALRARRTWATSGPRILMIARLGGELGGSVLPAQNAPMLKLVAHGTTAIAAIDLIRNGDVFPINAGERRTGIDAEMPLKAVEAGDVLYLRLRQTDGAFAYAGPWFVE